MTYDQACQIQIEEDQWMEQSNWVWGPHNSVPTRDELRERALA